MTQSIKGYSGICCSVFVLLALLFCFSSVGYAYYELDPTFGDGGIMSTDFGGLDTYAESCFIDTDNRIVLAGRSWPVTDIFLARYIADGQLDPSFGTGGLVSYDLGNKEAAYSCCMDSNANIVVAGYSEVINQDQDFLILRFDENGSYLDHYIHDFVDGRDTAYACILDSKDRSIAVGLAAVDTADFDFGLIRCTSNDLQLDKAITTDFWDRENDRAYGLDIDSQGRVVVVGSTGANCNLNDNTVNFAITRYKEDGTWDSGFGLVSTDFDENLWDQARSVVIDSDDSYVVVGSAERPGSGYHDFALARYNPDGTLDTDFGVDGKVKKYIPSSSNQTYANCCAIDKQGNIIVVGENYYLNDHYMVIARFTADGILDTAFTEDGKGYLLTDIGFDDSAAYCVIDDEDRIVVAGSTGGSTLDYDFVVARYRDAGGTVNEYTVTVSCGNGGEIIPPSQTVTEGENAIFTIAPDEGYSLSQYSVDIGSCSHDEGTDTITVNNVQANSQLSVSFEMNQDPENPEESSSSDGCNIGSLPGIAGLLFLPVVFLLMKKK